jgi:rod shape-determining protein MreD
MVIFSFFLAVLALFLQSFLIPRISILAFAPFLSLLTLKERLPKALWCSALSGALLDLLSDDPMGLHALNYTLATAFLYRYKRHFSYEVPFHFGLFTVFISSLSTLLQLSLLFLFDRRIPFDGKWILTDLIGMPILDGLYAFAWFVVPLAMFEKIKKYWVLFWLRKKNLSPTSH